VTDPIRPEAGVARKLAISVAVAAFTYLITVLTKQAQIWSLTMSIFIGGVFLVVQLLVEFDRRLAIMDLRHQEQFRKISKSTELFGRVEASELRTDAVIDLVQHATRLDLTDRPLLRRLVQAELVSLTRFLRELSQTDSADYPGEEKDWLFTLVESAAVSIKATSTIGPLGQGLVDENFWDTPLAGSYLDLQRDAIVRRRVPVRRIFIVTEATVLDTPTFRQAVRRNLEAHADVRILPKPPADYFEPLDFVLFDDQISYEFTTRLVPGLPTSIVQSTSLVLRERLVERRKNQFDEWWAMAVEPDIRPV
jgi:hypothetical protein